jgi:quercetin dioxygenase-like cupin family protein
VSLSTRRALPVAVALLPIAAGASYAAGAARHAPAQATRTVLAQAVDPQGARGRTLALSRVIIPAHTQLALHHHPGVQVAFIEKGTLTFTVRDGVVPVYRGAADQKPTAVRRIKAGQTALVRAGEWVVEQPRVVHFGANATARPVEILLATLFPSGSPASINVPD